tara:strand:+ start:2011 stop:3288 length:1278 start_codon:yes stop_codon:yes gene_type:complete
MSKTKPVLLIQFGPMHLFWTTGVYYLWELKDKYDFVLLVDDEYSNSINFDKIIKYLDIKFIYYQKKDKGIKLIKNLYKDYTEIFEKYDPSKILMYNVSFVENQVLLFVCNKKNKNLKIFQYQNSKSATNMAEDREYEVYIQAVILTKKFKHLKNFFRILIFFIKFRNLIKYLYYYKVIPFLVLKKTFKPHFNIYTGKNNNKRSFYLYSKIISKYFAYLECEAKRASSDGVQNPEIINHPLSTSGKFVNEILYGSIEEKNQILILPSSGPYDKELIKNNNFEYLTEFVANQYINFFEIILLKFKNFNIKFKLHPREESTAFWSRVIKLISEKHHNIEFEKSSTNSEYLILESKIIVSDMSTVLWWSMFLGNKVSISLDIFNLESGKEMLQYTPDIYYIDNLEKLKKINLTPNINILKKKKNVSEIL